LSDLENKLSKTTFIDIYISTLISIFKKNWIELIFNLYVIL
jgi:hypothetical protein